MATALRIAIVFCVVALIGVIAALPERSHDVSGGNDAPALEISGDVDEPTTSVEENAAQDDAVKPSSGVDRNAPDITAAVTVDERIREYRGLTNNDLSGAFSLTENNYIIRGEFALQGRRGGSRSKSAIQGIAMPTGTRIVQINVGRGSPANIFDQRVAGQVADDARILLVDTADNTYTAIGFFYARPDHGKQLRIDPGVRFDNTSLLPRPATTHQGDLRLIYQVTEGATLDALTYGDITVGTFNGITVMP